MAMALFKLWANFSAEKVIRGITVVITQLHLSNL
jgi:hypothetical protein